MTAFGILFKRGGQAGEKKGPEHRCPEPFEVRQSDD